ncbi:MAG: biotin--[acetyl-CoA-carboxylase] ligase [Bacteroidetes bacterium]|nr:biotin--[acetyl-CoA-carboxylase] ligase [Bacteroidota bacterium]
MIQNGSAGHGTVIVADFQQTGKGRGKNLWEGLPGESLMFSIILQPDFIAPNDQFRVSKMISVSIAELLIDLKISQVSIKWPNDIYVGDKKIAGILIENAIIGNQFAWCICGIGLNVNQKKFSPELPNPTSIALSVGKEQNVAEILSRFLEITEKNYRYLKANKIELADSMYVDLLFKREIWSLYIYNNREISGKIIGVNSCGQLVLQTDKNQEIVCNMDEIRFCGK